MFLEIKKTVNSLNNGGVIIYPSDTIWAIGCDATNQDAINKIYNIKKRDRTIPFICLVSDFEMLDQFVETNTKIKNIIESQVGPTTVIFKKTKNFETFPNSVGIRIPEDSFCKKLIKHFKKPIISTSANISGEDFPFFYKDINNSILDAVNYKVKLKLTKKMDIPSKIIKIEDNYDVTLIRS